MVKNTRRSSIKSNFIVIITKDIVKAYKDAEIDRKRAYLHFFFKRFWIKNKEIVEIEYKPVIQELSQANMVILSATWLRLVDYVRNYYMMPNYLFVNGNIPY